MNKKLILSLLISTMALSCEKNNTKTTGTVETQKPEVSQSTPQSEKPEEKEIETQVTDPDTQKASAEDGDLTSQGIDKLFVKQGLVESIVKNPTLFNKRNVKLTLNIKNIKSDKFDIQMTLPTMNLLNSMDDVIIPSQIKRSQISRSLNQGSTLVKIESTYIKLLDQSSSPVLILTIEVLDKLTDASKTVLAFVKFNINSTAEIFQSEVNEIDFGVNDLSTADKIHYLTAMWLLESSNR